MRKIIYCAFCSLLILVVKSVPAPSDTKTLADLKEILEGELNKQNQAQERHTRQHDLTVDDLWGKREQGKQGEDTKSDVIDKGWSETEVEELFRRLPPHDVRILQEFKALADRLNLARRLVALERRLKQQKEESAQKRARDHPISGFDPKSVGAREQDMGTQSPHQDIVNNLHPSQGEWIDKPYSQNHLEQAIKILQNAMETSNSRGDAMAASALESHRQQPRKPSAKDLEDALLAAVLMQKEKNRQKT